MESKRFEKGDCIAWEMLDGNTMAGEVTFVGFSTYEVWRVGGGSCTVDPSRTQVRRANSVDIDNAISFFANIGDN